jgi:hypothetical protein
MPEDVDVFWDASLGEKPVRKSKPAKVGDKPKPK